MLSSHGDGTRGRTKMESMGKYAVPSPLTLMIVSKNAIGAMVFKANG